MSGSTRTAYGKRLRVYLTTVPNVTKSTLLYFLVYLSWNLLSRPNLTQSSIIMELPLLPYLPYPPIQWNQASDTFSFPEFSSHVFHIQANMTKL